LPAGTNRKAVACAQNMVATVTCLSEPAPAFTTDNTDTTQILAQIEKFLFVQYEFHVKPLSFVDAKFFCVYLRTSISGTRYNSLQL
jgi:hypothetical protein